MSSNPIEQELIEHCAPTLAGIKSASLFNYFYSDQKDVVEQLEAVNHLLNGCGVYVEALLWREDSLLIYTYRLSHVRRELAEPEVRELLEKYGYGSFEVEHCIGHLKKRLEHYSCFPHEIGIFLGYPLEDVKGFIQNEGRNCKCCGLWKVYCNQPEKEKQFDKLRKCSEVYLRVFSQGRSIRKMTVCA